jgi:glutaconate CoA-transferase subunit A
MPKAAKRVVVTVEELVHSDVLRRDPDRTVLPGFVVDAVAEVRYGAHPTSLYPRYSYDTALHLAWGKAARDDGAAQEFLTHYVTRPRTQAEYLDTVGGATTLLGLVEAVRGRCR